ncbi:MAG: hypothetical protein MI892_05830 [Desulfobacterales bacterium]|nr:hypothetical protein [Desulfobacterales bacterium]
MNKEISEAELLNNGYRASIMIWIFLMILFIIQTWGLWYYSHSATDNFTALLQTAAWLPHVLFISAVFVAVFGLYSRKKMFNKKIEIREKLVKEQPAHPAAIVFVKHVVVQQFLYVLVGTSGLVLYMFSSDNPAAYLLFIVSIVGIFFSFPRKKEIKRIDEHLTIIK